MRLPTFLGVALVPLVIVLGATPLHADVAADLAASGCEERHPSDFVAQERCLQEWQESQRAQRASLEELEGLRQQVTALESALAGSLETQALQKLKRADLERVMADLRQQLSRAHEEQELQAQQRAGQELVIADLRRRLTQALSTSADERAEQERVVAGLRQQLSQAHDEIELQARQRAEQEQVIADLGRRLNQALAARVEDLGREGAERSGKQTNPDPPEAAITWDFETGDLRGWETAGNAFAHQPTFGDNPTARGRGMPSNHEGDYWFGGYENRQRPADPAGRITGDAPTGTLTSPAFRIDGPGISFLIGGGCDVGRVRAELLVEGKVVRTATGKCNETMERVDWNVSRLRGKSANIRLIDESAGGWGHINFDDVRF